uniref:Death-associated inhibitor of apoptosis 1 n=2 Tax=Culex pipiens TaxID=7175 RepID=A0A8D8ARE7_CULPI
MRAGEIPISSGSSFGDAMSQIEFDAGPYEEESEQDFGRFKFNARFQEYNGLRSRLMTFDAVAQWSGPRVSLLAEAGFFYTGVRDVVACFYCGLRLAEWKQSECPWWMHALHVPEDGCDYLSHMKGKRYAESRGRRPSLAEPKWCFDADRNDGGDWVPCADKLACALCLWEEWMTPAGLN